MLGQRVLINGVIPLYFTLDSGALARTGHTAEAIAQVAREEDIDHIVMGTRGLGGIEAA